MPVDYAIVIFHDENGNHDFDMSDGIPTEGYAYSNGAGVSDIAAFSDARITVGDAAVTEEMSLVYY